jgi:hypothetical protein
MQSPTALPKTSKNVRAKSKTAMEVVQEKKGQETIAADNYDAS